MGSLSRRGYAALAISLAIVIFLAVNIAANAWLTTARLDLTQNGLYTLDRGTRHVITTLDEPIALKFYYSKEAAAGYAQVNAYAKRVRDLIGEYAARSGGKITVQDIDPVAYTPAEDEATAAGLTGAPTDSGETVYFGLVGTNQLDGKEVIAFFTQEREKFVEYDLTSLIYRLAHPRKPHVGVISALPLDTGMGGMQAMVQGRAQPFMIYAELADAYKTEMIGPTFDKIPDGTDVLLIADPPALSDKQQSAIDRFLLKGGRALVIVDPMSELMQAAAGGGMGGEGAGPVDSDLPRLFRSWGIGYSTKKVIGDRDLAQRVQSNDPNNPVASYPVWLHLKTDNFSDKDLVTASLQTLNLASVGALHPLKGATTSFVPLISSSSQAGLVDVELARMASARPQELMDTIQPTGERFTIAARVSGPVTSAFGNGQGKINVIVLADSDIFDDRFWVRVEDLYGKKIAAPFADNGGFILNAIENLTGSDDLISLRTRATSDRPFTVVQKMQADAGAEFQAQEQMLKQHLTDTEQRLHALEQSGSAAAQQAEVEKFKKDLMQTRASLRDVQHTLRARVDSLGSRLAFMNIALVPIFIAGFAVVLASLRRRRRARGRAL